MKIIRPWNYEIEDGEENFDFSATDTASYQSIQETLSRFRQGIASAVVREPLYDFNSVREEDFDAPFVTMNLEDDLTVIDKVKEFKRQLSFYEKTESSAEDEKKAKNSANKKQEQKIDDEDVKDDE